MHSYLKPLRGEFLLHADAKRAAGAKAYMLNQFEFYGIPMPKRRKICRAFIKTNPPLLNTDKVLFNEYVELVRSRFLDRKIVFAEEILIHADTLIAGLKKKYNLKDGEE